MVEPLHAPPPASEPTAGSEPVRVLSVGGDAALLQTMRRWAGEADAAVEGAPDLPRGARLLAQGRWTVVLALLGDRPDEELTWWAEALRGVEGAPRLLRSFPATAEASPSTPPPKAGETVTVTIFAAGDRVKVTGVTKGRGFQGVVHRYHFGGGPETHGNTRHRKPGSIAPGTDPSRIIKGKRMPGHMGARRFTELGLMVVKVDAARNLLFVRGAVPGPMNGLLTLRKQGGPSRHD